jgi:glc operon protein GlcG
VIDGRCVGAVAVSGLSGAEDLEIARIGIEAILAGAQNHGLKLT